MNELAHVLERYAATEQLAGLKPDASGHAAIAVGADRTVAIEQGDDQVLVYLLQATDHHGAALALRAMQAAHHHLSPGPGVQVALRLLDGRQHLLVLTRIDQHGLDEHRLREAIAYLSAWLDAVQEAH